MADVHDLRRKIRELIHQPRTLDALLKDKPNWNQLASSFDVIADTEMAIEAYERTPDAANDKGVLYLMIYGLLQSLYVQQDAVESLVRAFKPNQKPLYTIESEPEAAEIRTIRNRAIGHPTVHGNARSEKTPGVQMSFHILYFSTGNRGFSLMTTYANGGHETTDVDLWELIKKNRVMIARILQTMKSELEEAEMEHRKQFRDEKLGDIFPATTDYQFEKVAEGARNLGTPLSVFGKGSLKVIADCVQAFRESATKRGLVNDVGDYEYFLAEIEYPLEELRAYFNGGGSLKDHRAAEIFTHFLRDKVHGLIAIARQVDEEYAEELKLEQL